jgi:hypothetical protein
MADRKKLFDDDSDEEEEFDPSKNATAEVIP